jgi:hypothetical protein
MRQDFDESVFCCEACHVMYIIKMVTLVCQCSGVFGPVRVFSMLRTRTHEHYFSDLYYCGKMTGELLYFRATGETRPVYSL